MATFLIAFTVVMIVGLLWKWLQLKSPREVVERTRQFDALDTVAAWPAEATLILTLPERRAHQLLTRALPGHIVLAQVPLSRFLRVPTRNSYHEWMRRVGRLCADLVVCNTSSQVVAVVNIRQSGKDSEHGRRRQERISRVLGKAGVRALTWIENDLPPLEHVRELVLGAAATPEPVPAADAPAKERAEPGLPAASAPVAAADSGLVDLDDDAGLLQPTPSTFFDEFDSGPVPLPPPERR